jgi:hypothetical protein
MRKPSLMPDRNLTHPAAYPSVVLRQTSSARLVEEAEVDLRIGIALIR